MDQDAYVSHFLLWCRAGYEKYKASLYELNVMDVCKALEEDQTTLGLERFRLWYFRKVLVEVMTLDLRLHSSPIRQISSDALSA